MNLAYIILVHKNPSQCARLINTLTTPDSLFIVHVDKKSSRNFECKILDLVHEKSRVLFIPRKAISWGGFSLVDVTLKAMSVLIESKIPFSYVKLLSGQCYPIKPISQINSYLQEYYPFSFMEFFSLPCNYWVDGGMDRISYFYMHFLGRNLKLPIKRSLPTLKPFGGSQFWCLTKECVEYICYFCNDNPQYLNFFKHVNISDEIFFQTILLNSPFKEHILNNNLLYIAWNDDCPRILTKSQLPDLLESSCLFARKFDDCQDEEVLDLLDQKLLLN